MFSSRLNWSVPPNRLSELLRQRRQAGLPVLDLTESNPTHAGLAYPAEQILSALADRRTLTYDPSPAGAAEAREAVAGYYAARGQVVAPDRILLTASTSEAYALLFKLLADPGDEVLVPRPSYPLFEFLAALESVRVAHYSLAYDGRWHLDVESLERSVTSRTRAVILVHPNNPTGSYLKTRELEPLIALCARHRLALIADEVFADFALSPDPGRVPGLTCVEEILTFCLSGLSKIAGLPQMKLGWIVAGGPPAVRAAALERLELIADTYLSVGTPVQCALPHLLEAGAEVRRRIESRTRENLSHLRAALTADSPCQVLDVEGGWYAILRVPRTRTEEEWALELLERDGVLVQPGFFYDFESEAYLVLSLLTPGQTFEAGVRRVLGLAHGS